jgi:hypothetical protein
MRMSLCKLEMSVSMGASAIHESGHFYFALRSPIMGGL